MAIRCVYHTAAVDDRVVGRWISDETRLSTVVGSGSDGGALVGSPPRRPAVGRVISQQQLLVMESTVQLNRRDMSPRGRRTVKTVNL